MNRNDALLDELYAGTVGSRHAFSTTKIISALEADEPEEDFFPEDLDELDRRSFGLAFDIIQCHFCHTDLHVNNNAMTRCMDGKEPAARGFGWISVIVKPFLEVPCCDICMDKPETSFIMA